MDARALSLYSRVILRRRRFRLPARIPPLADHRLHRHLRRRRGREAIARAVETRSGGLRANDFGVEPLPCWIGRVEASGNATLPAAIWRSGLRATIVSPGSRSNSDGFHRSRARRDRDATAPIASRSSSALRHRASTRPSTPIAELDADGHLPPDQRRPHVHQTTFARRVRAGRARHRRARADHRHRMLVQRKSVRERRAADRKRFGRRGDRRRRRQSVRQRAVRLQRARTRFARTCRRSTRIARGLSLGEAAGFALLEKSTDGQKRSAPGRLRRIGRRAPHVRAASAGPRRRTRA